MSTSASIAARLAGRLSPARKSAPQLEILDLRHFSAAQLRPLLRDEADRWQRRLHWDYTKATNLLLDYIDSRVLPGFVAMSGGRVLGYTFSVFEAAKAVIGDVYAFGETESLTNPICETLLHHLLELLQNTPGVDRAESQLLMFPAGALASPFLARGFRTYPRLFMTCDLAHLLEVRQPLKSRHSDPELAEGEGPNFARSATNPGAATTPGAPHLASERWAATDLQTNYLLQPWRPDFYDTAAELIHRCYRGHMDSSINDQYTTIHGAQRFLHNIIRFPGCGIFDPDSSWVLRHARTQTIEGVLLCSRIRSDTGHITQLCINPLLRGQGLGQLLLRHFATQIARRQATSVSLTVTEANTPALRLYQRNGFTTDHRFDALVWDADQSA